MNEFYDRDAVKVCPVCHKTFWIPAVTLWAYRKDEFKDGEHRVLYFCRYNCKRKYEREEETEEGREKDLQERAERASRKGRPSTSGEWNDRICNECRYSFRGKYGFTDCTVYSSAVNPYRKACRKFKEKYEAQK